MPPVCPLTPLTPLATPCALLLGYLHTSCACHRTVLPVARLPDRLTLAEAMARMRCPDCREGPRRSVLWGDQLGECMRTGAVLGWRVVVDVPSTGRVGAQDA